MHVPIALLKAKLFLWPVTTTTTSLDSSTVPTPTVSAIRGTASISLLKKRALARMVSYARVLMRVREAREEPGVGGGVSIRGEIQRSSARMEGWNGWGWGICR